MGGSPAGFARSPRSMANRSSRSGRWSSSSSRRAMRSTPNQSSPPPGRTSGAGGLHRVRLLQSAPGRCSVALLARDRCGAAATPDCPSWRGLLARSCGVAVVCRWRTRTPTFSRNAFLIVSCETPNSSASSRRVRLPEWARIVAFSWSVSQPVRWRWYGGRPGAQTVRRSAGNASKTTPGPSQRIPSGGGGT